MNMQDEKKIKEKHTPKSAKNAEGKTYALLRSPDWIAMKSNTLERILAQQIRHPRLVNKMETHWAISCR